MTNDNDAQNYLAETSTRIRSLATGLHEALLDLGCVSYVKTIYIGYDIEGVMVAALYGHSDHVEIALALPDNAEDDLLIDASHLTWRTLPVAAIIHTDSQASQFKLLAATAVLGVRTASHLVHRDNEFFIKSRRERRLR